MSDLAKSIPTKIDRSDLPRLKAYAALHEIDCVKAIARLLDLAEHAEGFVFIPAIPFTGKGDEIGAAFGKAQQ